MSIGFRDTTNQQSTEIDLHVKRGPKGLTATLTITTSAQKADEVQHAMTAVAEQLQAIGGAT